MCKRLFIVLALFVCGIAGVWADEIDEKQALNEAKAFLASHRSTSISSGKKMSSNTTLKLQGKVSGLYVFNATDGSGFVIVSNDDQTTPILGFGENGNLDTEKMPANMRAWLQGYADEIAWLQKNSSKAAKARADIGATRNLGSHATADISPLVNTKWDQGTPYNNLCPKYDGTNRAVTGCVATAMSQVMKYHEWPKEDTANGKDGFTTAIPGYTTDSYSLNLTGLPAIRFDWANMKNTYTGSETDATADAVATLMQYCGYSVEMDYGPSSGSNTDRVAFALKEYFDYNENTTQFVSRSMYTLANWTDLIYNELEQNRPVVYGGMSSGGGHEFVCDGYKYENGTDFFHINWGWGGSNDEYYVLSSLNPYGTQGIGGSSSDDGFHYGQDAVIGIQPSTGTGTVAVIPQNTIKLTLVSITASKETVAPGESVDITVKVKNNSSDVYDGDIMIYEENGLYDLQGKTYTIAAGETKECVFTITPAATGTYSFIPLRNDLYYLGNDTDKATFTVAVRIPNGLTVYDGTATSQYVPAYIYYFDDFTRSQFVIPAADLAKMESGTINSISFYTTSDNIPYTTVSTVDVYLKEVENTSISDFETKESSTIVYQGTLTITSITGGGLLTIFLATPYKYNGGNLMIGIDNTTDAGWKQITFYGQSVTGASFSGSHSSNPANILGEQRNFIPKTTFEYTPATGVCRKPTALALVGEPSYTTIELTWTPGEEGQDAWQICVNGDEDHLIDVNTIPYTLTGLTQDTEYNVKVRSNCGGGSVSSWSNEITFTTAMQYPKPTALTASNIGTTSATISWIGSADSYNLRYRTVEETIAFSDDFESGLGQWTIIRNGAGTASTDWRQFDPSSFSSDPPEAHSGDYVAMSRSWSESAYSVDNWLISPQVPLGGTLKYWVMDDGTYHEHYDIYISTTTNDISAFTKVYEPGDASKTWTEMTVDLSAFAGKNGYIAFRNTDNDQDYLLIDDVTIIGVNPTSEWVTVNDVTNPYTLTELTANTRYQVEAQGVYAGGVSTWSITGFTTPDANPVPSNIQATLAADGATLTWTGFGDSYNVQYRTAASEEVLFYEDFENGIPNTWTTIDADGDGHNWLAVSEIGTTYSYYANGDFTGWPHSGNNAATSPSYYNIGENSGTSLTSNQYLISPKLSLQGTLRFYANSIFSDMDSYEVLLSTTGTDVADFTTTLKTMAEAPSSSWEEVSINLSAYAGQQGYIAIHHVSENCYFLVIDDFGLYGSSTSAGSWQSLASVTETTATLSGLATNNGYEYRIQSVKDGNTSDWSETGEFALLTLQDEADNNSLIYNNTGRLAHVTLSGRTLFKDGYWNTLCLPFSLNATQLASAQMDNADIRTLDNASFSGSTLTLNFADKSAITAGTPYIIKWEGDGSNNLQNPVFANVTIDKTMHDVPCNLGDGNAVTFKGTYKKLAYTEDTPSILFLGDESTLYYPKANASIGAQRAYFELTGITAGKPASIGGIRAYVLNYGNETTGIRSIENGKLKIENEADAWYGLDGRKLDVKPTRKGLYIHNGNKVVIK